MKDLNILAIIPARSKSKGLKNKNIKLLNGKPMIAYTIEAAKKSGVFTDIVVSTDSREYAEISKKYGAISPFLRDENLSNDDAKTNDVIEDVIRKLEFVGKKHDYFMLLQPTSPLRKYNDIINALELMTKKKANSVISVCLTEHSPLYMNTLSDSLSMDNFLSKDIKTRRQELPLHYRLNGAIYLSKIDYFLEYKNLYKEKCYAYIMQKENSIDVDDEFDFKIAEYLLKENYQNDIEK